MGVITLALLSAGYIDTFAVPTWVILACALAMAVGTYAGGWRIVATLGHRITDLNMRRGMFSQIATAAVLFTTAQKGFSVSTTHVVTGSILGTDAQRGWRNTNWSVAGSIVGAWCLTIPCAAAVGAIFDSIHRLPGGEAITITLIVAGIVWFWRNRKTLFATSEEATAEAKEDAEAAGLPVAAPALA